MAKGVLLLVAWALCLPAARLQHVAQPAQPEEPTVTVEGVVGGDVDVPCSVFPNDVKDKVNLILWYKDHNEVPIYSYDTRRAMEDSQKHHLKDGGLKGRVAFTPSPRPPRPHMLRIKALQTNDAGRYTCRVDFLNAQSTTRTAELIAITPVDSVMISDSMGHPVPPKISPIPEGGTLNLTCIARGGNPRPKVSWWLGEAMVDDSYQEVSSSVLRNILVIMPVTRAHIHAVLSCRASASPVSVTSATVTIDMYLRPQTVTISGNSGRGVTAGQHIDLTCKARGSRPPPIIKWSIGGREIQTDEPAKSAVTSVGVESHLRLTVRRRDHGSRVTCLALNPAMPKHEMLEHVTLNVTYPPEVELRMGASLDGTRVKENSDLYLTCHYSANPPPHSLNFQHEGRPVTTTSNVVISGPNLVLSKVSRSQAGLYSCNATNAVGTGSSARINITVLYSPVCAGAEDVWAEPGKTISAQCSVQAQPITPITFSWVWTTTATSRRLQREYITAEGLTSKVQFTAPRDNGSFSTPGKLLGSLQCWAENPVGTQATPCIVKVNRPTPPEPPMNCKLSSSNYNTVTVVCDPGASMLPQKFRLQVFQGSHPQTAKLYHKISSNTTKFVVQGLDPGFEYVVYVSAYTDYGSSVRRKVEGIHVQTAENKMSVGENFLMNSEWFSFVVYGGGGVGLVILVLLLACLVRLRLRRSQHKCTVSKVKGAAIPEEAGQSAPAVRSKSSESQNISSPEKKSPNVDALSELIGPGRELGRSESRKYDDSCNTLQPIIRQGGSKRQPIMKETGRVEPIRSTQNRQVLFLEPPIEHSGELISPRRSDMMIAQRDIESPPYGHMDVPIRPLEPTMRRSSSITRHTEIPLRHSELPMRRIDLPHRHVDGAERHNIPDLHDHLLRHDLPPRHDLMPRHDYSSRHELGPRHVDPIRNDISPRHGEFDLSPYARRRLCSDSIKAPPHDLDHSLYPPPIRNTTYHDSLREFDDRYSHQREPHSDVVVEPPFSSGSSNTLSRESGYCSPRPPPGVFNSAAYRRHARSYDESSPHPPLTSIMKKSPSVSAGVGRLPDQAGRVAGSHPTYRSLPRPGKSRPPDIEDLNRYRALDRRFDLPFTGSLPRPEPRRPIGGSRLRFSDAKYFHVYPDKEKKQNRVVVDDAGENFV